MYESSANVVPAFLTKLWTLVEDTSNDDLITWGESGKSFHVYDQARFSREVLPLYFKHSNIASFIRQLNMYGFRKLLQLDQGGLKLDRDDMEFAHPCFVRGREDLLEHIKRKIPTGVKGEDYKLPKDNIHAVLSDVQVMKNRQESLTTQMNGLRRENETLWREVANLRQKHLKQQQIVNKLIQFLVNLVGAKRRLAAVKRSYPLMIDDVNQAGRPAKFARQLPLEGSELDPIQYPYTVDIPEAVSSSAVNSGRQTQGVTISEIFDSVSNPSPENPALNIEQPEALEPGADTSLAVEPELIFDADEVLNSYEPLDLSLLFPETMSQPSRPTSAMASRPTRRILPKPFLVQAQVRPVTAAGPTGTRRILPKPTQQPAPPPTHRSNINTTPGPNINNTPATSVPGSVRVTVPAPMKGNQIKSPTAAPHSTVARQVPQVISVVNPSVKAAGAKSDTKKTVKHEPSTSNQLTVAEPYHLRNAYDKQLDSMQADLDSLRELFNAGSINVDAAALLDLFSPDAPLPASLEFLNWDDNTTAGNELIQYTGNDDLSALFDLGDLQGEQMEENLAEHTLDTPPIVFTSDMMQQPPPPDYNSLTHGTMEEID